MFMQPFLCCKQIRELIERLDGGANAKREEYEKKEG